MDAPPCQADTLRVIHPDRISHGDHITEIGTKAASLLAVVLASGGKASLEAVEVAAWGLGREVQRGTVRRLINRLNTKLADSGCATRLVLEGGAVHTI